MVMIADGGTPRTITGYAREAISGGQFVGGSTALGAVGSDASGYQASDILVVDAAEDNFIGIALNDAVSGAPITVAMKGLFIVPVDNDGERIEAGNIVNQLGNSRVSVSGNTYENPIGRALTAGSTGDYVVLSLGV